MMACLLLMSKVRSVRVRWSSGVLVDARYRDERPVGALLIYHADSARGIRLLLYIHREVLSAVRSADFDRRSSRIKGEP